MAFWRSSFVAGVTALFADGTLAAPSMTFASEPGTGFYRPAAGTLAFTRLGVKICTFTGDNIQGVLTNGPAVRYKLTSTSIVPVFVNLSDQDTGVGFAGADELSLTAGGVEGLRLTENVGVLMTHQVNAGLTADSGSVQGGTPLTSSFNVIATCATPGDSVTLPTAVAGRRVTIYNSTGVSADVFPASGDNLGAGLNLAAALAGGANVTYLAYDDTNWFVVT